MQTLHRSSTDGERIAIWRRWEHIVLVPRLPHTAITAFQQWLLVPQAYIQEEPCTWVVRPFLHRATTLSSKGFHIKPTGIPAPTLRNSLINRVCIILLVVLNIHRSTPALRQSLAQQCIPTCSTRKICKLGILLPRIIRCSRPKSCNMVLPLAWPQLRRFRNIMEDLCRFPPPFHLLESLYQLLESSVQGPARHKSLPFSNSFLRELYLSSNLDEFWILPVMRTSSSAADHTQKMPTLHSIFFRGRR